MTEHNADSERIERQILAGTSEADKHYHFDEAHNNTRPVDWWFQESDEGKILFVVFYTQACRWSRCLGCNLPARMSQKHVGFRDLMVQIDYLFSDDEVLRHGPLLKKVIVSNNGSVLDETTFSSTALIYLIARLNQHLPNLAVLSLETRAEHVDLAELEFIARALRENDTPTVLELAIGFEAMDCHIRNEVFKKGLPLDQFEQLCGAVSRYGFHLKCYFMQKPVPDMSDEEAVADIYRAIDYLSDRSLADGVKINLHLNPTYVAFGTVLEERFKEGKYSPPLLRDVARAALHAEGKPLSFFLGLSDEGLACEGGSFIRPGEAPLVQTLEAFNQSQDFGLLRNLLARRD